MCAILGIEVTLVGSAPRGAFLVASNHVLYLDILVLASLYPSAFVAKLEIGAWPVFGWIARSAGTLFVDRSGPATSSERDARCVRTSRRGSR